ncbi:MAG: NAD-binding protein, partial [Candidatus Diapherotrites archaeon]|nr:NAD-binding protein [Candidatus Diapherotrites archaeon]
LFWVLLAVVFVLNPLVFLGINLLLGFGLQTGLAVGLTLFQASEFSFILAGQGLELGQISAATFNAAVWVILLSMIATPYMARLQRPIHSFLLSRFSGIKKHLRFFERSLSDLQRVPKDELLFDHIIVAGAGVFGRQIVDSLADSQKVLVLEQDPDVVRRMVNQKVPAVYSSRNNLSVLEKVGLHRAKMLVVTIPDHPTALSYVRAGREANRKLVIFCRAHTPTDALDLYAAGANLVILPQVMASNYCLQQIQQTLTTGRVPHGGFEREWLRVLSDPGFEK